MGAAREKAGPVELKLFDSLDEAVDDAGLELGREARPWLFDRIDWFSLVGRHTPPEGKPLVIRARDGNAQAWLFLANDNGSALAFSNWYCLRTGPVLARANGTAPPLGGLADGLRKAGITRLRYRCSASRCPAGRSTSTRWRRLISGSAITAPRPNG
jgi:hypothetical protein